MKLDIPVRRISGGRRIRLNSEIRPLLLELYKKKKKTRSDASSEDEKRQVYEYWKKSGISRPTGNKSDVKRERLGPNIYASHMIQILEKTQTEVYTDFRIENPEIKISQRSFENCKPFFVRPIRQKDRQTCCCRYHVEIKSSFKAYEESDESESAMNVKWEKFEYINFNVKGDKTVKKLQLVTKETKAGVLSFTHYRTNENFSISSTLSSLPFGPQDALGGISKRQADLTVLRDQCRTQTAKDLYNFGTKFLTTILNQELAEGEYIDI
ncbi:unnamed protein product [Mytilus coruscus]|uniref:Uncharacterized protein n=1 Tax=Mytilus coruscus TaxID=42192 RepID=A0A6J8DFC5_MYTCO|nr:unnamed protein product [Mytilus coruscus]